MKGPLQPLFDALTATQAAWIEAVCVTERDAFLLAFASAARAVGKAPLAVADRGTWGADEIARTILAVRAASLNLVGELYAQGDNGERQAILRALSLLPDAEAHLTIAIDACRMSVQPVFEAIACENPYPAKFFPELHFNQMVLKAVFTGVSLARIEGLGPRVTPELARMAAAYASERRAAGRAVPTDLGLLHPESALP